VTCVKVLHSQPRLECDPLQLLVRLLVSIELGVCDGDGCLEV